MDDDRVHEGRHRPVGDYESFDKGQTGEYSSTARLGCEEHQRRAITRKIKNVHFRPEDVDVARAPGGVLLCRAVLTSGAHVNAEYLQKISFRCEHRESSNPEVDATNRRSELNS